MPFFLARRPQVQSAVLAVGNGYPRITGRVGRAVARTLAMKPLGSLGALIVIVMAMFAILGPWIAPYDALRTDYDNILVGPRWANPFGTDHFGRDILSRLIAATRPAFVVAISSVVIGVTTGAILGLLSAFKGGMIDALTQRFMDAMLAVPIIVLVLAIVAVLGPQDLNVAIAIGIVNVPIANRVLRSVTLSVKQEMYIQSAVAIGASDTRIMLRHVAPNVVAPYIVLFTAQIGWAIIAAAALSFLGAASPPPEPSWGGMLSVGTRVHAETAPWMVIFPGVFITLTVYGFNLVGDAIRDLLDPRLRSQ